MNHIFRTTHYVSIRASVIALVLLLVLNACGAANITQEPSAEALLPNLTDYQMEDTLNIQDAVAKVAGVASLGAAQPELTAAIAAVSGVLTCYQKAGAIKGRTYVNKSNVLQSGVVVVINKNLVSDPTLLINCTVPHMGAAPSGGGPTIQPCAKSYTLSKDNNQFYIAYAATNQTVCAAFCSALQGCTP